MTQPPTDPNRHPGYGPNPPGPAYGPARTGQGYDPAQSGPAQHGPAQHGPAQYGPAYGGQNVAPPPPGAYPRPARNPLGLASLIVGAIPSLLGVFFLLVQAALITSGDAQAFGAVSTASSVLSGLLGAAALILGLVALARRGASKTLAAAGIALGAATLVGVLGSLLYAGVLNALY